MISASDISLLYGRRAALAPLSLEVGAGERLAVLGPNGAGKTSLLRVCAGLLPVASGEAVVLGEDLLADRRGIRRRVGLLGHSTHLYDDLTVAENVRFFLRAAGLPGTAAPPSLARLGLTGRLADLPASRLSAGQRRRAALAVIAARDPELWLLDEPHAGLDADGRVLVDELVAAATRRGAAVVMASHEGGAADELAHRVVVVSGGRTEEAAARPRPAPDRGERVLVG